MKPKSIDELMLVQSTGFAVVRDGVLLVGSVGDSRDQAMVYGLSMSGVAVMQHCNRPGCNCFYDAFKARLPDADVVEVSISVVD